MKRKTHIIFLLLICSRVLQAQPCDTVSFQKIFWNKGIHNSNAGGIFLSASGYIYFVGTTESANNKSEDIWLLKATPGGNVIWSKNIGMKKNEVLNGIKRTSDGGFIFAGNTNSVNTFSEGCITKIDSNGNVQWALAAGAQYSNISQIAELADGGYVASGTLYTDFEGDSSGFITAVKKSTNIILRIDKNGNTLWWKSFRFSNLEELRSVLRLDDGSLIVTGLSSETNSGYVIKLDANGNILWMNEYKKFNKFSFPRPLKQADNTIHLHVGNKIFFLTADGKFFDGREIELNSKTLNLANVQVGDVGKLSSNIEIYEANLYPQHSPIIFAVKDDSTVIWAHQYEQTPDNLQHLGNAFIYKNGIYISGDYVANNLSDNLPNERLSYLIKANANGATLCSDTFDVSFKIKVIPYPPNITHTFINEGSLKPFFIYPYTEVLNAAMKDDCAIENCCKAVSRDTIVTLCQGNFYKLPPNDSIVKTNGVYSFAYPKFGGCDSIVNYKVQFKSLLHFSMNDTCLINNQPVTFTLPSDSNTTYMWQDGSLSSTYTAKMPGEYWVTATSSCNIFRDTVNVSSVCALPFYVPSAFTPNNDGLNDVFKIAESNGQHLSSFTIYNRYGQRVFYSENISTGWNGTCNGVQQPNGTYIYIIKYTDLGGTSHTIKNTLVLIR